MCHFPTLRFSSLRTITAVLALFTAFGLAAQPQARAQMNSDGSSTIKIGPRIGIPVGDVSDTGGNLFFGADGRIQVGGLPDGVVVSPSADFYLTDDFAGSSLTIVAVDLNGLYEFQIESPTLVPYLGGGLAITRISVDASGSFVDPSSTEVGLNLVGGARFPLGSVEPFAQLNAAVGAERVGITAGLLFGL
jgi:hypothetical protein